jgi:hypothetical protein
VWLPPQFNPASGNDAAILLGERFAEFSATPGLIDNPRQKIDEEHDVVDALAVTALAAAALPDAILLSAQLEAPEGLCIGDGLSTSPEEPTGMGMPGWRHTEHCYGLPHGDTLVLPIRTGTRGMFYKEGSLFSSRQPAGLVGLSLYASAVEDIDAQGAHPRDRCTGPCTDFDEDGFRRKSFHLPGERDHRAQTL